MAMNKTFGRSDFAAFDVIAVARTQSMNRSFFMGVCDDKEPNLCQQSN